VPEIAEQLVEAGVLPERESEDGDLRAQWKQALKRARRRYRLNSEEVIVKWQS